MNRILIISSAFVMAGMAIGWAQPSKPLFRLQPGMAWQVEQLEESLRLFAPREKTSSGREPVAGQARIIRKVTRGSDHLRLEIFAQDGRSSVTYITAKFLLTTQADGSYELEVITEIEESGMTRLRPVWLREFDWMKGLAPLTSLEVDGVECEIYALRADRSPAASLEDLKSGVRYLAAIGKHDHFPRRLETPGIILRYVPQPRVTPSPLPEQAQRALDEYPERLRKRIQRHALPR